MQPVARSLHVLSLGLWCGMSVFFSFVVALSLFGSFETVTKLPAEQRPAWFPLTNLYSYRDNVIDGPREQGSRAAGLAVGGIFPWYYLLQGICGFVALGTALGWAGAGRWQRRRVWIIAIALLLVVAGWPLEQEVSRLRPLRNDAIDAYLDARGAGSPALREQVLEARGRFFAWHQASLFANLAVVVLVVAATALAGHLPPTKVDSLQSAT